MFEQNIHPRLPSMKQNLVMSKVTYLIIKQSKSSEDIYFIKLYLYILGMNLFGCLFGILDVPGTAFLLQSAEATLKHISHLTLTICQSLFVSLHLGCHFSLPVRVLSK